MSRRLDKEIAKALGHELVWVDEYLSEFMESTKYRVQVINYVDEYDYEYIPHYSNNANDMLIIYYQSLEYGWNVQISALEDKISINIFAFEDGISKNGNEEILIALIGEAAGLQLPETFARAFYQAKTGEEW